MERSHWLNSMKSRLTGVHASSGPGESMREEGLAGKTKRASEGTKAKR